MIGTRVHYASRAPVRSAAGRKPPDAAARLQSMGSCRSYGYRIREEHVTPFLAQVEQGEVTESAVRGLAHFAHNFSGSIGCPQAKEDRALHQSWADRAAETLDTWWQEGRLEVGLDGRTMAPGDLDLTDWVKGNRALVRGNRIKLKKDVRPSDEALDLARKVAGAGWKGLEPGGAVEQMVSARTAAESVRLLVEHPRQAGASPARVLTVLLQGASQDDRLKSLMQAHLPTLRTVATDADAQGELKASDVAPYLSALATTFPGAVDTEWARREVGLLLVSDQQAFETMDLFRKLGAKRADLVEASLAPVFNQSSSWRPDQHLGTLLSEAVRQGRWRPNVQQSERIASWVAPTDEDTTVFEKPDHTFNTPTRTAFTATLNVLEAIHEIGLPEPVVAYQDGPEVPVRTAVIRRLIEDPAADDRVLCAPATGSTEWSFLPTAYGMLEARSSTVDWLGDRLKAGLALRGRLSRLEPYDRNAAAVLASLDADPELDSKLAPVLVEEIQHSQPHPGFRRLVGRLRKPFILDTLNSVARGEATEVELARLKRAVGGELGRSSPIGNSLPSCQRFGHLLDGLGGYDELSRAAEAFPAVEIRVARGQASSAAVAAVLEKLMMGGDPRDLSDLEPASRILRTGGKIYVAGIPLKVREH